MGAAGASGASGGVAVTEVSRHFPGVLALDRATWSVAPGETVALLGPNGAGKSTTINILLGLDRPDSGSVRVLGRTPGAAVAQGRVGAMLQSGSGSGLPVGATVAEVLDLARGIAPRPMDGRRLRAVAGLADILDRRTEALSGGEARRLHLGFALAGDPELLILDEPTVGLDVSARRAFWVTVRALAAEGRTVLFATHYLDEAEEAADRVVLLARGQVVADGPAGQIRASVGMRTIRFTLPGADARTDVELLRHLPGVVDVAIQGDSVRLRCSDADAALRAALTGYAEARDIEVTSARLEDAFLALTTEALTNGESAP